MKKFNKIASEYANFFRFFIMIALGILGALLTVLMLGQLLATGRRTVRNSFIYIPIKVLDEIVTFFLFFEFSAMIVAAPEHMEHTSLNSLMSLGITALSRNLTTAHGGPMQILAHSIAILLLIIGIIILNGHIKL